MEEEARQSIKKLLEGQSNYMQLVLDENKILVKATDTVDWNQLKQYIPNHPAYHFCIINKHGASKKIIFRTSNKFSLQLFFFSFALFLS